MSFSHQKRVDEIGFEWYSNLIKKLEDNKAYLIDEDAADGRHQVQLSQRKSKALLKNNKDEEHIQKEDSDYFTRENIRIYDNCIQKYGAKYQIEQHVL